MKRQVKRNSIFIVVPAFNEEKNIIKTIKSLIKQNYPLVVVDDGSTDNTVNVLSKYKFPVSNFSFLRHRVNLGKGAAMKTGADFAFSKGATAVVFIDSDGQHDVNDLGKLISAIENGYEVVFGSRNMSYGVPLVRFLGNKIGAVLVSLFFGIYVSDLLCGYRAITFKAYREIVWESTGYGVETEMVVRTGLSKIKYCEVPVATLYLDRVKGVTLLDSINILMDVVRWRITL